ncbi:hypothetical protein O9929_08065 [Vibrio lentus]|nr:hypothetical protein [Vibrio lentus]
MALKKIVRGWADGNQALTNISDTASKDGIDWKRWIFAETMARFAADATLVGLIPFNL